MRKANIRGTSGAALTVPVRRSCTRSYHVTDVLPGIMLQQQYVPCFSSHASMPCRRYVSRPQHIGSVSKPNALILNQVLTESFIGWRPVYTYPCNCIHVSSAVTCVTTTTILYTRPFPNPALHSKQHRKQCRPLFMRYVHSSAHPSLVRG